jgi:hypothetical protein
MKNYTEDEVEGRILAALASVRPEVVRQLLGWWEGRTESPEISTEELLKSCDDMTFHVRQVYIVDDPEEEPQAEVAVIVGNRKAGDLLCTVCEDRVEFMPIYFDPAQSEKIKALIQKALPRTLH